MFVEILYGVVFFFFPIFSRTLLLFRCHHGPHHHIASVIFGFVTISIITYFSFSYVCSVSQIRVTEFRSVTNERQVCDLCVQWRGGRAVRCAGWGIPEWRWSAGGACMAGVEGGWVGAGWVGR